MRVRWRVTVIQTRCGRGTYEMRVISREWERVKRMWIVWMRWRKTVSHWVLTHS